jgi:putative CocE/NonD family hydrolase
MRDGVRLALDVHLPADLGSARVPTILRMTRYFRGIALRPPLDRWLRRLALDPNNDAMRRYFVARGYAWVDVDVRGSGASFGDWACPWSPDEVRDGAEIVDWVIRQPWSSGLVGATGNSYDGTAAEFLLVNQHPAVRAIAPRCSLFDVFTDVAFPGGLHNAWFTAAWSRFNHALDSNHLERMVTELLRLREDVLGNPVVHPYTERALRALLAGACPVDDDRRGIERDRAVRGRERNLDVHRVALEIDDRDDVREVAALGAQTIDLFSPARYLDALRASGAAVLSLSGWFDVAYSHAAIKRHLSLDDPRHRLVLGPWMHGAMLNASPHAADRHARFDLRGELLRFFDQHLRARSAGLERVPSVRYFTMGAERWQASDAWPPREARTERWHFAADRALVRGAPDGALPEGRDVHRVDPRETSGTHSRWRSALSPFVLADYPGREAIDARLLTYTSAPLEHDLEVTGHPVLSIELASSEPDGALFAYLEDVTPSGRVLYVTEGQLRLRHRRLSERAPAYRTPAPFRTFERDDAAPMVPGAVTTVVLDLLPVSYLFRRGHRVRIALAGADRDHFEALPGREPVYTVHRGGARASRIELPVVGGG